MTVFKKRIQISFWVFMILAVFLVIFSVQNSDSIEINVLFWKLRVSIAILLISVFLTGAVTGALFAYRKFLPAKDDKVNSEADNNLNQQN